MQDSGFSPRNFEERKEDREARNMRGQLLSTKYALLHGKQELVLGSEQLGDEPLTLPFVSDVSLLPFHS